jgi:RNA polymerase sigma-70 factor (ECF subfamily)
MSSAPRVQLKLISNEQQALQGDRALVIGLKAGSANAAIQTYRKFARRIFRVVQRSMGPSADAEDITQEIFMRVYARVHLLRDPDALSSFVLSVAIRVIKWQLRQRRVRRIMHLSVDGRTPDVVVPGEDIEGRQALMRLYNGLDKLSANERTVFVLKHIEGMDLQEIADAENASLSTVKRRLRRAQAQLASDNRVWGALKS